MGTATVGAVDSTATGFGGSENTQANTDAAERGDKSQWNAVSQNMYQQQAEEVLMFIISMSWLSYQILVPHYVSVTDIV